jgi:hypothetical protein
VINRRGQILSTDLVVSLTFVIFIIGLIVTSLEYHYQQTASTVESAKMHQIAMDAAAVYHYNQVDGVAGGFEGLPDSANYLGYQLDEESLNPMPTDKSACVVTVRGYNSKETEVWVCR